MKKIVVPILILVLSFSCGRETLPKPKSYLTLKYPENSYMKVVGDCPFSFEISNLARIDLKNNCWATISYPQLRATIHITYREVHDNLDEILKEVERLTFEHTIKADAIPTPVIYEDFDKKVFGTMYNVEGNVASNIQIRITDSLNHVLSGALYFYSRPNYDSIIPAIKYLEKDLIHLVETFEWKELN